MKFLMINGESGYMENLVFRGCMLIHIQAPYYFVVSIETIASEKIIAVNFASMSLFRTPIFPRKVNHSVDCSPVKQTPNIDE